MESWARRLRRRISRNELSLKLLRLKSEEGNATEPGLLIIQIDALSRRQLERAMAHQRMPFLRTLMRRDNYGLFTHYSGQPSSTPVVQGELFYGVKSAVPAFSFYDRKRREVVRMYVPQAGERVEEGLKKQGEPLLKGGSAYSNVYQGGAAESHFCVPDLGWGAAKKPPSKLRFLAILALNASGFLRVLGLIVVEFFLAWVDFFRGIRRGESFWQELKFVPTRVGVSIMLREFIVAGASVDLARGLPVVHLNFLGYDEQAHRRGPTSAFAHWTLLGIDGAIRRLYSAAARSHTRDYSVWIYSDHGQEESVGFEQEVGATLREVMDEVFLGRETFSWQRQAEVQRFNAEQNHWAGLRKRKISKIVEPDFPKVSQEDRIVITAMGPVGHVYDLDDDGWDKRLRAEEMVKRGIPLVLYKNAGGEVEAVNAEGHFVLPRDAKALFEQSHPAWEDVGTDLARVANHPQAGDFVISGWRRARRMVSFADENGSHGGPGREELSGFLLLPPGTAIESSSRIDYYGPPDLRRAAFHYLIRT